MEGLIREPKPSDKAVVWVLKGAFMLYLLPGILFLAGLGLGGWFGTRFGLSGDAQLLAQLAGGVGLIALGFVWARRYGRVRSKDELVPVITGIVEPSRKRLKELRAQMPQPSSAPLASAGIYAGVPAFLPRVLGQRGPGALVPTHNPQVNEGISK